MLNLGIVERLLGNSSAALEAYERSFAVATHAGGANHPESLAPRIELAFQRALTSPAPGQLAGSESDLAECLALARHEPGSANLSRALHSLGYVQTLAGRPRAGEPLLRVSLALWKALPPADYRVARVNLELGECLERQGRTTEARECYRAAAEGYRTSLGASSWVAQDAAAHLAKLQAR